MHCVFVNTENPACLLWNQWMQRELLFWYNSTWQSCAKPPADVAAAVLKKAVQQHLSGIDNDLQRTAALVNDHASITRGGQGGSNMLFGGKGGGGNQRQTDGIQWSKIVGDKNRVTLCEVQIATDGVTTRFYKGHCRSRYFIASVKDKSWLLTEKVFLDGLGGGGEGGSIPGIE